MCGGSQICEHDRQRSRCKECLSILEYLVLLQRGSISRLKNLISTSKPLHSIEYLGCEAEYFKTFIERKFVDGMNWNNIHLDHIKPVSKFDLENHDEFLSCCHYTNFQPLFATDNLSKSNKWREEDEKFWLENIKDKEYMILYIPK
jgi:hypothetical protein